MNSNTKLKVDDMKTIYTAAAIILLSSLMNTSSAQWKQVGYMITGTDTAKFNYTIKSFGNDVYFGTDKGLFKSNDNGDTWQSISYNSSGTENQVIRCVHATENGEIFAGSDKSLYKSDNGGNSWTTLSSLPQNLSYNDITQINGNIVVSHGENFKTGGVYYSADGGTSWTMATGLPDKPANHFFADGKILYVGDSRGIYKSNDSGQSWSAAGTSNPEMNGILYLTKLGNSFFAGDIGGKGMYTSTDNANTWTQLDTNIFTLPFCQLFCVIEANGMLVANMDGNCNPGGSSAIKASVDTGKTWNTFTDGLPQAFCPVLGKNSTGTNLFTKEGFGYKVYRYGAVTGVNDNPPVSLSFVLDQNYPNPFNPSTIIKYQLPEDGYVTLRVYDVLGKEIATLVNEFKQAGNYSSQFLIQKSQLPSGIYFYTLRVNGYAETKKMILAK